MRATPKTSIINIAKTFTGQTTDVSSFPTSEEIKAQSAITVARMAYLHKQLVEKQSKLELAQEKNAEYLQQVNQLL